MTGGTHIIALSDPTAEGEPEAITQKAEGDPPLVLEQDWEANDEAEASPGFVWREWLVPAVCLLAILGWTGLLGWDRRHELAQGLSLSTGIALFSQWAIPALLVGVVWLLAMRLSQREAQRFGDAARLLSVESDRLELRLATVNRELSLAREFIAAQSRDLEALGRVAVERISQHADKLTGLVEESGRRVDSIGTVSEAALDNMEKLRGQLPVIASSAKDVTNQIGNAGRTAHNQVEELIGGFQRLNEFGQASERQVLALTGQVDQAIFSFAERTTELDGHVVSKLADLEARSRNLLSEFEVASATAVKMVQTRSQALSAELGEARLNLDQAEAESLTSLRARIATIRDEGSTLSRSMRTAEEGALKNWQDSIANLERQLNETISRVVAIDEKATAAARQRIAEVGREAGAVDERLDERDRLFAAQVATRQSEAEERHSGLLSQLNSQLEAFDALAAAHRNELENRHQSLAFESEQLTQHLTSLNERLETIATQSSAAIATLTDSSTALDGTDSALTQLTDNSVRLLELIQASVQHSTVDLPAAIAVSDQSLSELEVRSLAVRDAIEHAATKGQQLSNHIASSTNGIGSSLESAESLRETLAAIASTVTTTHAQSRELADTAQTELRTAIETLSSSVQEALSGIGTLSQTEITALAARIGEESRTAIDEAIRSRMTDTAVQLERAASNAADISREATVQLRDQLSRVDELAGNLERRVAQARERAEEQIDSDFARRVALITESLNSNAIDIARALDSEVTDTAWANYLKGDRGVFTRRAVKLLEPAEAKAVAQLYGEDSGFRDHVSRYIHDFEAMLRQLLSTRDGHALGVTLLSSDMGKLYVALAQAIERLRN